MNLRTSLQPNDTAKLDAALGEANREFMRRYPGESDRRQAVHTVYGGAHIFRAETAQRLGVAVKTVENLQGRLFSKLGTHNRSQTLTKAYRMGLVNG